MIIAHKIALDPNDRQATYFARACGTARFCYNWALAEWQRQYAARKDDPSLTVDGPDAIPQRENQAVGGVDLGVKALATLSDGGIFDGPKALRSHLARLRRLSRSLSREVSGSANRRKAKARIARLHARVSNIRKDAPHKLTTDLVRRYAVIGIEDLNLRGMMANGRLARSIADMGFHEFRRQLDDKAAMTGGRVVVAERWFPSSKTCSACGHVVDALPLSVRDWTCPVCGARHDRDVNAARNLKRMAESSADCCPPGVPKAQRPATACGEEGSGGGLAPDVKPASLKQELSVKGAHEQL